MEKKHLLLIPAFALLILGVFVLASINNDSVPPTNVGESVEYHANVCVSTTGDFEGRETPLGEYALVECSSNVLYTTGKELIEQSIGNEATADACDWIELCDADVGCGTPEAGSGEAYTAITDRGLAKAVGTYSSNGDGNWTISKTFTASGSTVNTNVTHLINGADAEFAGNSFTLVSLEPSDTLLLNWTVWVS